MRTDRQAFEDAARRLTPPGATLTHLCSTGWSTFQVETRGGDFYALKVGEAVSPECERSDEEWSALLKLDHPHLVPYLDAGSISVGAMSYRWLTMKLVEGMSLEAYLGRSPSHDLTAMVGLLHDAIAGAAALWGVGIAHRDLSPENMIVTPAGRLVVVDLGMRVLDEPHVAAMPPSESLWMAPEQIAARTRTRGDWRSDQYVLGLLGYRLVTGWAPLSGPSDRGDGDAVEAASLNPTVRNPDVSRPLAEAITTMMAPNPQDRWPHGDVLLAAIDNLATSLEPGRVTTYPVVDDHRQAASCAFGSSATV